MNVKMSSSLEDSIGPEVTEFRGTRRGSVWQRHSLVEYGCELIVLSFIFIGKRHNMKVSMQRLTLYTQSMRDDGKSKQELLDSCVPK